MADSWLDLMRVVERTIYVSGVPAQARLLEAQAVCVIPPLGGKPWPAQYLAEGAALAWAKMRHAAGMDGVTLWIYSGYRSHIEQVDIDARWQARISALERRLGDGTITKTDFARIHTDLLARRPARPGWSRHESGTAADVLRSHDDPDAGGPRVGPTDRWLADHAHEYGYHRTVPAEMWHWEHT